MKRLISSTLTLALALSGPGTALVAQDYPSALIDGQLVWCLPNKRIECPEGALCIVVKNPENCEERAAMFLAELAAGEAPALSEAPVVEETPAVEEAPLVEEAPVVEESPVVEEAPLVEEAPAVEEAPQVEEAPAVEEAPQVEEAPAVEEAPQVEEAPVVEEAPLVEEAPAVEEAPLVEEAPAVEEAPVVEEAPAAEEAADLSEPAPDEAALDETAPLAFDPFEVMAGGQPVLCLPDPAMDCPEGALCTDSALAEDCQINAEKTLALLAPVEVVQPDAAEVEALAEVIASPETIDPAAIEAAAGVAEGAETDTPPLETEVADGAVVTEEVLTEADTRSSTEEFDEAPTEVAPGQKSGLTALEAAGLAILGTLVIGALLDDDREVVENTGDRVVVRDADGNYSVYKDDNALLRQPGTTVRTETFADGSSRTVTVREDGTQIVTIRDASGRVLHRSSYDRYGILTPLIDDLGPEDPIRVEDLPPAEGALTLDADATLEEIWEELDAIERADYAHAFSLRQIRDNRRLRDLAPTIDVGNVTFDSGSAAIRKSEARKLQQLGRLMAALIEENPAEIFLIEGHTDAVGRDPYNLALSDRRAESVARALTEFYDVPPENLVVQGYGETELKIDTEEDERANRRAVVRIISPLLKVRGG